jgi:hypothetical protein
MSLKSIITAILQKLFGMKKGAAASAKVQDATQPALDAGKAILQPVVDAAVAQAEQNLVNKAAANAAGNPNPLTIAGVAAAEVGVTAAQSINTKL